MVNCIRELAKAHNMSLRALEEATGIGNGAIAKWDSSDPRLSNVVKVAKFLGVTVDYLLGDIDCTLQQKQLSRGQAQLNNAIAIIDEADRLLLAGAILQEIRRCGRFDAAAFLAPSAAVPVPAGERDQVDHDVLATATPPDNTLSLPMAKKDRQPEADGQEEKTRFIPMAARGGSPFPEGGMWYTEEQYQRILAAIEALPPMDPDKIKDL